MMEAKAGPFRFYLVLLAIFTIGRWGLSLGHADYEKTHQVFSLAILTFISSAYFGLMIRVFLGGSVKDAMLAGAKLAVASEIVILVSTALSYALGLQTFFNYPRALNVAAPIGMGEAMVRRLGTFFENCILNGIVAAIGFGIAAVAKPAR